MKLESLRIFNLRITFAAKPTLTVAITTTMAKRIAQYSKKEKKKKTIQQPHCDRLKP